MLMSNIGTLDFAASKFQIEQLVSRRCVIVTNGK